jgi:hypothetical protein
MAPAEVLKPATAQTLWMRRCHTIYRLGIRTERDELPLYRVYRVDVEAPSPAVAVAVTHIDSKPLLIR